MQSGKLLFYYCFIVVSSRNISAETRILRELLNETLYDRAVRPPGLDHPDDPCIVEIDVLLNSVGPVSNLDMELTSSFYLRQEWTDPRLRFTNPEIGNETIAISHTYVDKLWKPDLFFTMGRESYLHDITVPNLFIRLQANGTILYSQRITATMKCFMDLINFPHDKQHCHSSMMSYSYTTDDLVFQWSSKRKATGILPSAFLAEFTLSSVDVDDCTETFATGTFTCLKAILALEREMGFYLTQTYIPSIMIVMLSWASFWIDHEAVPARISVGLLTVLTITTQSSGARSQLPRVSYIKAIDVWMSVNLLFVFAAYMQYAFVTVMSRRYKRTLRQIAEDMRDRQREILREDSESTDADLNGISVQIHQNGDVKKQQPPQQQQHKQQGQQQQQQQSKQQQAEKAKEQLKKKRSKLRMSINRRKKDKQIFQRNSGRRVDFHSRYLFPLVYIVFNIFYWSWYLTDS